MRAAAECTLYLGYMRVSVELMIGYVFNLSPLIVPYDPLLFLWYQNEWAHVHRHAITRGQ